MNRKTLARRRLTGGGRYARTSPEGGGGGTGNGGSGADSGTGTDTGSNGSGTGTAGAGGAGTGGTDKGFPEGTPLVEMSVEQQLAYHRYHSRQWQARAEARKDYDQVAEKARQFDELVASQATEQEKAVNKAKEEGRTEALREANEKAVTAILRGALATRGKTGDELDTLVAAANPGAFITDGNVDADKVAAYATSIAGAAGGGSGGQQVDTGQGRRTQTTGSGLASGRERYEARRGGKSKAAAAS